MATTCGKNPLYETLDNMEFINRSHDKIIRRIAAGENPCFAVAFWGNGAEKWVPKGARIICNLKMGGTNPHVIKTIMKKAKVQQSDKLHAKIYLNDHEALVTSANASANGMGLEGKEQGGWQEAGIVANDPKTIRAISAWFEKLWDESATIGKDDLHNAMAAWKQRQANKPSLPSFRDFDIDNGSYLLNYWGHADYAVNPRYKEEFGTSACEAIKHRIDQGFEILPDDDRKHYKQGSWILGFQAQKNGAPPKPSSLVWVQIGEILKDAVKITGEARYLDAAPEAEAPGPIPFDIKRDKVFKTAFSAVISKPRYKSLWPEQLDNMYYTPERLGLIKKFWREMKAEYRKS